MKKLFAVLLALTLVLSMGTMALAADTGTITINNALEGATYNVYKMLAFTPSNESGTQGIYTIVAGWEDFFAAAPATNYFVVTTNAGQTTVALKDGVDAVDQTLAKAAIAYAEENKIPATVTKTADGDLIDPEKGKEVKFEGLALGYYAIDTSLGTMCALTRATSEFDAYEKNEKPDIDKFVQEDKDDSWGKVNDADIDQVVNYKSTITVGLGATNYVMHDTMEKGLTFNYNPVADDKTDNDVVVKLADGTVVDAANYTVVYPAADGHTFDVEFENSFIEGLAKGTQFTVYYYAILNENANIVTDGNDNTVKLTYGEDSKWETAEHKTTTYTWKMDVLKYTKDGDNKVELAGAKFQLTGAKGLIKFTEVTAEGGVPTYMVDANGTVDTIVTDENGKFEIVGLDEGAYELTETEAPTGYNKLANPIDVVITSNYDTTALTASYDINDADPATIEVENKTGGLLPETGGIGTTIFYIVGITLMLGAGIILISKKRMAAFA